MYTKPLILVGGGGHCKSVIDAALSAGREVKGILDRPDLKGSSVLGVPVVGSDLDAKAYVRDCEFVVTVGSINDPSLRVSLWQMLIEIGAQMATVLASTARVSPFARVGKGAVVLHNACVNACASIGENSIINTLANVDHDCVVGSHTHISTCASINGNVSIGDRVFIGSNTVVNQGVSIGSDIVVGSGCLVHHRLSLPGIYAGHPLRKLPNFK
ncbi:MAG: acetyltransferase [Clostridium sp.]|nr:acetyltransferase [Clostridium sp.]